MLLKGLTTSGRWTAATTADEHNRSQPAQRLTRRTGSAPERHLFIALHTGDPDVRAILRNAHNAPVDQTEPFSDDRCELA
jgi:hypothetical protein